VESLSYAAFAASILRRGGSARLPTQATFELTRRCPLSCQHCYNNLPVGDQQARASELQLDDHRRILDQLSDLGCLWLLYTGGEIFARRDFLDIYGYATKKGFIITLFTNGTQITPAIADRLAEQRPLAIEITLYGNSRETYERLTGVAGSYDRCRRGIDLLLERNLPLKLKTVALTINKHELDDMKRFAEELGVEFKFDAMMNPRLDCSRSPVEVRLQPEECVELDLRDDRRMAEWQQFGARFLGPARPMAPTDEIYQCGGGISSFAVDPYGGMSICVLSEREKFALGTGSVREGWETFLAKVRRKKTTRVTKCTSCALRALCGMCPANGELESADPEAPVDFLCQVAHLRAHTFGFAVPAHGDCEYCPGGAGHEKLMQSAARLKDRPAGGLKSRVRPAALSLAPDGVGSSLGSCASGECGSCKPR
jgi:radical SAM protein with 4Fe4S-binding SPASM domain